MTLRQDQPLTPDKQEGGTDLSERVARLETHALYVRRDIFDINENLKILVGRDTPTKADLWQWRMSWTAVCVGAIALIVGGIIGGLSWLKPDPTVISVPAPSVVLAPDRPAASPAPLGPQQPVAPRQ